MKRSFITLFSGLLLCGFASGANAAAIQWASNGHYYDVVNNVSLSWDQAKLAAETSNYQGIKGHLATITSREENLFISNNFSNIIPNWLGGFQPDGSDEPNGGWSWITGEPWGYTNWGSGEPNNLGYENSLHFWTGPNSDGFAWNDANSYFGAGYVVEYEPTSVPAPEPTSMILGLMSLAGVMGLRKRNNEKLMQQNHS